MKKVLSVILALLLLLSLAACGEDTNDQIDLGGSKPSKEETPNEQDDSGMYIFRSDEDVSADPLYAVTDMLDPKDVYANLEYVPEMFYGEYALGESYDLEGEQLETYMTSYDTMTIPKGETGLMGDHDYPVLPYRIQAGHGNISAGLKVDTNYEWAQLNFYTDDGNLDYCNGRFEVEGNVFRFYPVRTWQYSNETKHLTYQMSDYAWEYEFSFSGPYLTLSQGDNSITLTASNFLSDEFFCQAGEYLEAHSESIDGIGDIFLGSTSVYLNGIDYEGTYNDAVAGLREDGLFILSWKDEEEIVHTRQFVYFLGDLSGLVLADMDGSYLYTAGYSERYDEDLGASVSVEEKSKLENMTEEQVAEIVEKRANLLVDLAAAYQEAGLNVTINEETGEIIMDSSVLFDVDSSEVSAEGQAFLAQFIDVYTSVVFNEKYNGFVSTIMVEGHTDTSGDYDYNLELSQKRADSVKAYCLSVENEHTDALTDMLVAAGYSYTHPIYTEDGQVDMDASRRVAFRFLINLSA